MSDLLIFAIMFSICLLSYSLGVVNTRIKEIDKELEEEDDSNDDK